LGRGHERKKHAGRAELRRERRTSTIANKRREDQWKTCIQRNLLRITGKGRLVMVLIWAKERKAQGESEAVWGDVLCYGRRREER